MKKLIVLLSLIFNYSFAFLPVTVVGDSWSTMLYQAQSITQFGLQVKALTTQAAWIASSNQDNLTKLASTLDGIQSIGYTGNNIAQKFAELYPGSISEQSLKNAASYTKIATVSLQSSSAVLQGLAQIQQISSSGDDPVQKILLMAQTGLSQAEIAKAGTEIAVQEYNTLRNLQQINSMQTQLVAQQMATDSQKTADQERQTGELKKMVGYRVHSDD